ncbi:MAG: hypothetical protein U9M90_03210 [Patescibacteria group bacterium]|nr:hypothetical protein [Patescibacteria group bacterium]
MDAKKCKGTQNIKKITRVSVALFVFLLVLSGCEKKQLTEKTESQAEQTAAQQKREVKRETENISGDKNKKTAGNQTREAIQNNKRVKCVYQIANQSEESEKDSVEIFIDGDKYRSTSITEEQIFRAIFDGKTYYSWLFGEKSGTKMSNECIKELKVDDQPEEGEGGDVDLDNFKTVDEILGQNLDMKCEETGPFDLVLPEDVEFIDQCEMLKNQMRMIEQMKL